MGIRTHTSVDEVGERLWNPQGHRGDGLGKRNPQATARDTVGVRSSEDEDAVFFFPFFKDLLFIYLLIYLFYLFLAALGLSCGTRDLLLQHTGSLLWCTGFSLVVARGFSLL